MPCLTVAIVAAGLLACSSDNGQLTTVQKKLSGLTATTHAVAEAWFSGDVSPTFSATAFQQTLQLLDKQRAVLNASPQLLLDGRGAALSRQAEQLSRALALLIDDARNADPASARQHLSQVPSVEGPP